MGASNSFGNSVRYLSCMLNFSLLKKFILDYASRYIWNCCHSCIVVVKEKRLIRPLVRGDEVHDEQGSYPAN